MKIKAKLIIGFSTLMLLMLVLTFISYERMHDMNGQLDRVYHDRYIKVRNSSDLRGQINEITKEMANSILNSEVSLDDSETRVDKLKIKAEQYISRMQESTLNVDEKLILSQVENTWETYKTYLDKQFKLLQGGDVGSANVYRNSVGVEAQNALLDNINSLSKYQDMKIDEEISTANQAYQHSSQMTIFVMSLGLLLGLAIILWVLPSIGRGLNTVSLMINSFGKGKLRTIRRIKVTSKDEIGHIAKVFQEMSEDLEEKQEIERKFNQAQQEQSWISSQLAKITDLFRGVSSLEQVAQMFINEFTPVLGGRFGALYIRNEEESEKELYLAATYATDEGKRAKISFNFGEGLVGQCALDQKSIHLRNVPHEYLAIQSGLGDASPAAVMIYPVIFEENVLGVIEVANFLDFTLIQQKLLSELSISLGIVLNNVTHRIRVEELLRESQALTEELQVQSEELQSQQEELRRSNESLEQQAEALKRSEDLLQRQQEELEHFNTELLAKTRALQEQVREVEEKNEEIEATKNQLEQQAMELAVTSKYKSEFLANMSHELRTPLNSLLILSQLLSENKEKNLTEKQIEYAQTIYVSGSDLLKMIDEILDLSKVDAGKMELSQEDVSTRELEKFVQQNFDPVARKRSIELKIEVEEQVPDHVVTDGHRLKQILRNLLSNAFKFTSEGWIQFRIFKPKQEELPEFLTQGRDYLAMSVQDTGIGIPRDKTGLIFEAFQQADGTTSRKYGGTGLGLSISRGLAALLGGGIGLSTKEGEGSTFTLYLPEEFPAEQVDHEKLPTVGADSRAYLYGSLGSSYLEAAPSMEQRVNSFPQTQVIEDDRESITPQDKVLLIIEDDASFAQILVDMARDHGFKTLIALDGDTGLRMARNDLPDAIILDIQLPVIDGWSILDELKNGSDTRHIPVHVVSVVDDMQRGLSMGALAYLQKPASKEKLEAAFAHIEAYMKKSLKHLLLVEANAEQSKEITELIEYDDVVIQAVTTGEEALSELRRQHYDCMVLDLLLSDMTGYELLDQIRDDESLRDIPIIIYTGKDLDPKEEMRLRKYTDSIIIKDVKSPERLLDETTLFLHRVEANLPEEKRKILRQLHNKDTLFEGKKILLVDDDIRNVFALSSVLEDYHMEVVFAENGQEALDKLEEQKDFDLILMDMMMPEMDGYEAMRRIREIPEYAKLPIIALTAKAMKEDRVKCIEAGASDYMKKPIHTEQLLSLMRVWLYS